MASNENCSSAGKPCINMGINFNNDKNVNNNNNNSN